MWTLISQLVSEERAVLRGNTPSSLCISQTLHLLCDHLTLTFIVCPPLANQTLSFALSLPGHWKAPSPGICQVNALPYSNAAPSVRPPLAPLPTPTSFPALLSPL